MKIKVKSSQKVNLDSVFIINEFKSRAEVSERLDMSGVPRSKLYPRNELALTTIYR
jgi:hypothetical protein